MFELLVLAVLVFPKIAFAVAGQPFYAAFVLTQRVRDALSSILYESRIYLSWFAACVHKSNNVSHKVAGGPRLAQLAIRTQSPARSSRIIQFVEL